jgi:hypothetical protein
MRAFRVPASGNRNQENVMHRSRYLAATGLTAQLLISSANAQALDSGAETIVVTATRRAR